SNTTTTFETMKSLHDIGKQAMRINSIYPRTFGKRYEDLFGLSHIIITIEGIIYDIEKGVIPTSQTQDGYLQVNIQGANYLVHRLVAMAFCINYNKKNKIVCHKNKDRADNRAVNLMWTNSSYIANRRVDGYHKKRENIKRPIKSISEDGEVQVFTNANYAMKALGVQRGNIYKVCKGERRTAGGYSFSYATVDEYVTSLDR
ncbi:MAG: HNH endonuclease, partial [Paraclostridium sp.]